MAWRLLLEGHLSRGRVWREGDQVGVGIEQCSLIKPAGGQEIKNPLNAARERALSTRTYHPELLLHPGSRNKADTNLSAEINVFFFCFSNLPVNYLQYFDPAAYAATDISL